FRFRASRHSGKLPRVSNRIYCAGHRGNFVSRHDFLFPQECGPKRLHLFLRVSCRNVRGGRDRSLSTLAACHRRSVVGHYDPKHFPERTVFALASSGGYLAWASPFYTSSSCIVCFAEKFLCTKAAATDTERLKILN